MTTHTQLLIFPELETHACSKHLDHDFSLHSEVLPTTEGRRISPAICYKKAFFVFMLIRKDSLLVVCILHLGGYPLGFSKGARTVRTASASARGRFIVCDICVHGF